MFFFTKIRVLFSLKSGHSKNGKVERFWKLLEKSYGMFVFYDGNFFENHYFSPILHILIHSRNNKTEFELYSLRMSSTKPSKKSGGINIFELLVNTSVQAKRGQMNAKTHSSVPVDGVDVNHESCTRYYHKIVRIIY